jgi:hypothetical protein
MILNRNQMRKARDSLKALPPEQREQLRYQGIGPGDSYIGMWRMVNCYRFRVNALCKAKTRADVTPIEERQLEKDIRYYCERITFIYGKLLVHEKPKLASIEFKGDQQNPVYQEVDLKNLSNEELHALARILPKLGGASQSGEPAAGARRDAPARGGGRAPTGRARASR